jgi:hypothetical protein
MNESTKSLTDWAINKIQTEYPKDVALLVGIEGHSVNGDGHGECFDYFVPATERGYELSQTFIIDGIGHDLYPRSWERTEQTAQLEDRATICLGNAKILYSRSKEDTDRFESIRQRLFDNLQSKEFTYKKALEGLDVAMDLYRTMMFEDSLYKVRMAVGYVNNYLAVAVGYINGSYYKNWRDGKLPELEKMEKLPSNFIEYYRAILNAKAINEMKSLAHLLISTTREFLTEQKPQKTNQKKEVTYFGLADWYQELSLTFRRLRYYCDINNSDAAFIDAVNLQNELCIVHHEFELHEMDLLSYFDTRKLEYISRQSMKLEQYIIAEIEGHGVKLNKYDTLEDFLKKN